MKKRQLNEEINRIKSMMKSINENDFIGNDVNIDPSVKDKMLSIINKFKATGKIADFELFFLTHSGNGRFILEGDNGDFIEYGFILDIESLGYYDPGDRDTAPYGEGPQYDVKINSLVYYDENGDEKFSTNKDFTDFFNIRLDNTVIVNKHHKVNNAYDLFYYLYDYDIQNYIENDNRKSRKYDRDYSRDDDDRDIGSKGRNLEWGGMDY